MPNPYTPVTVTGFNASPPPDDSSRTAANLIKWQLHLDNIGNPLKNAIDSINTNVNSAFSSIDSRLSPVESTNNNVGNSHASAYLSSNQSVSNNTWTKIAYDVERYDVGDNFASSEYTAPNAGKYAVFAGARFSTQHAPELAVYVNGSRFRHLTTVDYDTINQVPNVLGATVLDLSQGDTVAIYVRHQSNGGASITGNDNHTWVQISRLV